jgi:7,8-dihydropterin-6-yl-methyl-4-(beta-D-ribofuranosyl)aminobenzene 5'-phosphate synthase
VYAVIGGFYLAPYAEDYVRQTIAAFKELDVDYVIPLHCSGEVLYELAKARNANQVAPLLYRNSLRV